MLILSQYDFMLFLIVLLFLSLLKYYVEENG
jgi:hypothetical protein